MKKILTLTLTGVLAAAALAVESAPSNTVGFISRSVNNNTYASFSACPMGLATGVPASSVIGGQGASGDRVLKFVTAWATAPWTATGTWSGLVMDYNGFYLYNNRHGVAGTLVIAGDVIPEGTAVTMGTFTTGLRGWGNPLPMDIVLDTNDLELNADGLNSGDKIMSWNNGWSTMTFNGTSYGGLTLAAGKAFLFKTLAPFTWDYTVPAAAAVSEVDAPAVKVAKVNADLN